MELLEQALNQRTIGRDGLRGGGAGLAADDLPRGGFGGVGRGFEPLQGEGGVARSVGSPEGDGGDGAGVEIEHAFLAQGFLGAVERFLE